MRLWNNLFTYATNELSQDAFLCWLLSFAGANGKESQGLRACAEAFLRAAIPDLGKAAICVDDISRQKESIDILVTINGSCKLIIEDKTYTGEHSDQLVRYKQKVRERFPGCSVHGVYYKTGFQGDYGAVRDAGYTIIDRRKMIAIMTPFADAISNDIWQDYYAYLQNFEAEAQLYRTLPISEWDWRQINAFYDHLYSGSFFEQLNVGGSYGYVSNRSGGFQGMWFGDWEPFVIQGIRCMLYVQLEFVSQRLHINLKLGADKADLKEKQIAPRALRESVLCGDGSGSLPERYGFHRPARFGSGASMTVGVYQKPFSSAIEAEAIIKEATREYLRLLDHLRNGEEG